MDIREGMTWPPQNILYSKIQEHSAWYSGSAEIIANYYAMVVNQSFLETPMQLTKESFWGRQIKNQGEVFVHVPVANDISETSANLLFSEMPNIRIGEIKENKEDQKTLDKMLTENGFFRKLLEAAEVASAIGGVFIKIAWDKELSEYPIPVIWQADQAIPTFKFGMLDSVIFWENVKVEKEKYWRVLEEYSKGMINYKLYKGTADRLGFEVKLDEIEETKGIVPNVATPDILAAVYVPNILPNKLNRSSYIGRSDYMGIEGLMDALDEVFSLWSREITLAQAKILLPESYLRTIKGDAKFNPDTMIYVGLDVDPTSDNKTITPQQFSIRADQYEKTALNYLERIVTSAGYSPQSFGLSIQGRAESGLALQLRERKSFATKAKKEIYWDSAIKHIIKCMMVIYKSELNGSINPDLDVNVSFNDGIMNNMKETADAVNVISTAIAASVETKVRMLHPDWNEEEIQTEVELVKNENNVGITLTNPDVNSFQQNPKDPNSQKDTVTADESDPTKVE